MDKTVANMKSGTTDMLLTRVKNLHQAALRDFENRLWGSWERHLKVYNRLLQEAYTLIPELTVQPINPLRANGRGSRISPSVNEKAKLSEVLSGAAALLEELQQRGTSSGRAVRMGMTRTRALKVIQRICDRFYRVAQQLDSDKPGCQRYIVRNEADVQKLLQALFLLDFDDVRPEEWTPSYAGGSSRIDFLIWPYGIAVETKIARRNLSARLIGDQLLVDLARYQQHPKCRALFCFVYDPQGYIKNPFGLERDLEAQTSKKVVVKAAVRPRRM